MSGEPEDVPDWEDEFLDRVGADLMFNYDLERDYRVRGETFPLYGSLEMDTHKQFIIPHLSYGHQHAHEHLFVDRHDRPRVEDLRRFVDLGHDLAEEWVEANEEHFSTDFTFGLVADDLTDDVRAFVGDLSERQMLKYGFHGHYEVNLFVVSPETEDAVASDNADVAEAFQPWATAEDEEDGVLGRLRSLL